MLSAYTSLFLLMLTTLRLSSTLYSVIILFNIYSTIQTHNIHPIQNLPKKSFSVCDQFLNASDCYYFACIDSIYQCGPENLLVQFSYAFCEAKLERTYNSLTVSGQSWAKAAQTCLMQELNYFLKSNPSLTCTEIDRYVLNRYPICLTQSHSLFSLCSIVCNNLEIFIEIFENWNLKNLNLKRLLLETSHLCQEQSQMEYVIDITRSNTRTIFWSLCLDSLKTKFHNFHPNEVMININENSGMFAEIKEEEN